MAITVEEQVIINLTAELSGLRTTLAQAERTTKSTANRMAGHFDATTRSINRTMTAVRTLAATVVGVYGIRAAKAVAETADTWNLLEGRIRLVVNSTEELTKKQTELFAISQEARVGYAQTADLYTRIARSTRLVAVEEGKRLEVTEAISKSLVVSGASALSANAALVQLGQAFAADFKSVGQEIASVREQTPRLFQAITDGMHMTRQQFRQALSEGKINSKMVLDAISQQAKVIGQEFAEMPVTMGQAMTQLDNQWMQLVGAIDDATGASEYFVGILHDIRDSMQDIDKEAEGVQSSWIDTLISIAVYFDKTMDGVVVIMFAVELAWEELGARFEVGFKVISAGIVNVFETGILAIQTMAAEAKLKLMELSRFLLTLNSPFSDAPLIDISPVSEEDVAAQKVELNRLESEKVGLAKEYNETIRETEGIVEKATEQTALALNIAMDKAAVSITERKAIMREYAKEAAIKQKFARDAEKLAKDIAAGSKKDTAKAVKARKRAQSDADKVAKRDAREREREIRRIIDLVAELQESYEDIGADLADSLTDGDFEGAFKNLYSDIEDVFFKPFKEEFANLFGKEMMRIFSSATDKLVAEAVASSQAIIATKQAEGEITAAVGIATQAEGDPYSAWVRMAAMAASMAALGFVKNVAGGGSTVSAAQMKEAEGITSPISTTVEDSLESIENNSTMGLTYSSQMVNSLNELVRLSDSAAANIGEGITGAGYVDSYDDNFWSNTSKELISAGIQIDPVSLKGIEDGMISGTNYMVEKVTKEGWFTGSEKLKVTETGATDKAIMDPINAALQEGFDALQSAAESLGMSGEAFDAALEEWVYTVDNFNFEGMSQEEISETINGLLGDIIDDAAAQLGQLVPLLEEFQMAGEGLGSTAIRLSNEFEVVGQSMMRFGIDIGDVGKGGVRASQGLIKAAGGLDKLQSSLDYFFSNFLSDEQQLAANTQILQSEFNRLNIVMPVTAQGFSDLVLVQMRQVAMEEKLLAAVSAEIEGNWILAQSMYEVGTAAYIAAKDTYEAGQIMKATWQTSIDVMNQDLADLLAMGPAFNNVFGSVQSGIEDATRAEEERQRAAEEAQRASEQAAEEAQRAAEEMERAAEAARELAQRITEGIAGLRATWAESDIEGAGIILEMVQSTDSLSNDINYKNFINRFNAAAAQGLTEDQLAEWQALSSALRSYHDAIQSMEDEKFDKAQKALQIQIDFYNNIISKMDEAYLGSLSYLSSAEKAAYAAQAASRQLELGNTSGYFSNLAKQLQYEKKMSVTKEEYAMQFDEYMKELKNATPEKTTEDVVKTLEDNQDVLDDILEAIEKSSYQGTFT